MRLQLSENDLIATGTNRDDLGDYRPGLQAAGERRVWQPYVEAGVDKKTIRVLARQLGLGDLSELPAQPCLSSRIETGTRISADDLKFVHRVETALTGLHGPGDIRCRITKRGVVVQLPDEVFVDAKARSETEALVSKHCIESNREFNKIEAYKMGSAFVHFSRAPLDS